jgi:hypothetical protein
VKWSEEKWVVDMNSKVKWSEGLIG